MTKLIIAALALSIAAPAMAAEVASIAPGTATAVVATKGKMIVAADGARLAPVYRVASDGAQIILDGRMVTIPAATIALVEGKLTTSLTKSQVVALR